MDSFEPLDCSLRPPSPEEDQVIFVWKKKSSITFDFNNKRSLRHFCYKTWLAFNYCMLDGITHVTVNETCPIKWVFERFLTWTVQMVIIWNTFQGLLTFNNPSQQVPQLLCVWWNWKSPTCLETLLTRSSSCFFQVYFYVFPQDLYKIIYTLKLEFYIILFSFYISLMKTFIIYWFVRMGQQ